MTPWCQSGSNRHSPTGNWSSRRFKPSMASSARVCISVSIALRSRFNSSSRVAIRVAAATSSVSRHSIPSDMSSRRPAAFKRGPTVKPRSVATIRDRLRPPTSSKARMPGTQCPARMRCTPCCTRIRLLRSSGTTSATVPNATRSRYCARFGSAIAAFVNQPCSRKRVRNASMT